MSKFECDFDTILEHLNSGDFGIAKRLYDETIKVVLDQIEDTELKKQFEDNNEFPFGTGNWALERTILQSLMESQKASVLLSLNYLKIFGELEYVQKKFSSGPNPEVDPNSYIATSRRLSKQIPKEYEGGFSEISAGRMPPSILLGKYQTNGIALEPTTSEKSGKVWIGQWPQYRNFSQYESEQTSQITSQLQNFEDEEFKQQLITKRTENLRSEYDEIESEAQLKSSNLTAGLKKPFLAQNVTNQDGDIVTVNVEEDYDITTSRKTNDDDVEYDLITAKLKPDLELGSEPLIREDGTKRYQPSFISGNTYSGIGSYISRLLPVLLQDGITNLVNLSTWIADTNKIVGEIASKRISNEFEFMDPEIAQREDDDELKAQYYSEGEMIFNGSTKVEQDLINIVFKVLSAVPDFEARGELEEDDPQMKYANTVITFMSLSMNAYTEMLDVYKKFLLDLMNPLMVPAIYAQFLSMSWLRQMNTKQKLLERLGSTDGTIFTTKLFEEVAQDWDNEITEKNKDFYEELINKYLEQVSAVYNTNIPKISI